MQINIEKSIISARSAGKTPAFSYDRVSTEKQADTGNSLTYQKDNAELYAERAGLIIVHQFSAAESAFKEGRVVFNKMLDLAMQTGVNDIIFKNTDRLGRNDIDWPRCKALARGSGLRIHLYELGIIFSQSSTAEEEMFLDNTSTMAKYWSNKISQSLKKSYAWKAKQGIPPARFPVGYLYDKEKQIHIKDKDKEEMLNFIFDTFDNGNIGLVSLASLLNKKGYKSSTGGSWEKSYLEVILKNPIYAGFFFHNGIEYQAHHEPYYDKARYYKRLRMMNERRVSARKRKHDFPLSGILRAGETGRVLTGEIKKGRYVYYTHRRPDVIFKQEVIFKMIDSYIENLIFTDDYAARLKSAFKESVNEKLKDAATVKSGIVRKISALEARQQKFMDLYADDDIDKNALKKKLHDIRIEIDRLLDSQKRLNIDKEKMLLDITTCIDNLKELPYWYAQGTPEEKGDLLKTMIVRMYVHPDRIEFEWLPIYQEMINGGIMAFKNLPVRKSKQLRTRSDDFRTAINDIIDSIIQIAA